METYRMIQSQYTAALNMLEQAVRKCPDELWAGDSPDSPSRNPFWHVAYHVLFYTHLYLQPALENFTKWEKHREGYNLLGPQPGHPPRVIDEPFERADVLEYLQFCREQAAELLPALDMEGPSGFFWLEFNKLETQIYNIRHIQQHTGELCERLGSAGVDVDWISRG